MTFTLSHAEEVWLNELEGWLRSGGLDDLPARRLFMQGILRDVIRRFENAIKSGAVEYSTLREQLQESVEVLEAAE